MAPPKMDMRRIKDILRLKLHGSLSHEEIARSLSVSKGVVTKYSMLASAAGLSQWEAVEPLSLADLERRLFGASAEQRQVVRPDFARVHIELRRKGVTLTLLWEEYRAAHEGQRCWGFTQHKRRNVLEHLPEDMQASVKRTLKDAWSASDAETGRRQLQRLATSLQARHPGAAASLREGLDETLTLQELGITGALYRTLRTTNPIENLHGSVARYCRNFKRWGDGQMVLRWVASALSDAAHRMRKLRGCKQMSGLLKALDARRTDSDGATIRKAA